MRRSPLEQFEVVKLEDEEVPRREGTGGLTCKCLHFRVKTLVFTL